MGVLKLATLASLTTGALPTVALLERVRAPLPVPIEKGPGVTKRSEHSILLVFTARAPLNHLRINKGNIERRAASRTKHRTTLGF